MEEPEEHPMEEDNHPRKIRRRKKLLYQNILKQMEFYFSDANLSKDRFLAQLIKENPYVDINIFLTFSKIRALTENPTDIVKALRLSEMLTVSEDNTKVKRNTPLRVKNNEDECTIYVERLPSDTEHEWLTEIFSKFGNVDYVSIPKYKHNKMIKGFAFIEYDKPESASKALEYFEFIGCKLPMQMPPEQLASIATFEHENMSKIDEFIPTESKQEDTSITKQSKTEEKEVEVDREKRRLSDPEELNIKKKLKFEDPANNQKNNPKGVENTKTIEITIEPEKSEAPPEEQESKQKTVKKQKTKKENTVSNESESPDSSQTAKNDSSDAENKEKSSKIEENNDEETENMGEETKNMGEETENMGEETENMGEETENMGEETENMREETENMGEETENMGEEVQKKKKNRKKSKRKKNRIDLKQIGLKVLSKKEWKQLRNKYLNLQRQKMKNLKEQLFKNRFSNNTQYVDNSKVDKNEEKTEPRFKYAPGCIIQFLLPEVTDTKKLKAELKTQPGVEYIDMDLNGEGGFIRFSSKENCEKFLESPFNWSMKILEGQEETEYWEKILESRESKLQKSKRKQRGREKLLKKAEKELGKHIRFETAE